MSRKKKGFIHEKPWKRAALVLGVIGAIGTVIFAILDFPAKWRAFRGPTPTPTSISFGNRCKITFDNNQIEYVNLPELRAITINQVLQAEVHLANKITGIDLGCEAKIPFSAQVDTSLLKGDSDNFICLAFGGKPAPQGTLENYYAFCVSNEKKWLLLYVDSQTGPVTLDDGRSEMIFTGNSQNKLNAFIVK